jgi:hypothetical protein
MLPTLGRGGVWLVAERVSAWRWLSASSLRVGDVVWCKSPRDPSATVVKRIVAVGGEEVPVVVGGSAHVWPADADRVLMQRVPAGHVWLQGDNLADSTDSRDYGPVPLAMVNGKVKLTLYPAPSVVRNSISFRDEGAFLLARVLQQLQLQQPANTSDTAPATLVGPAEGLAISTYKVGYDADDKNQKQFMHTITFPASALTHTAHASPGPGPAVAASSKAKSS